MEVTAQYEGEEDFGSFFTIHQASPDGASSREPGPQWMTLYGFQGAVTVMIGHWVSFRNAVRRLLSLPGPKAGAAEEPYTLVHYDAAGARLVEMEDDLSLGDDGVGVEYIARHLGDGHTDWRYDGINDGNDDDGPGRVQYEGPGAGTRDQADDETGGVAGPGRASKALARTHPGGDELDASAFFVRLRGETTPGLWKPTTGQLRADVACIVDAAATSHAYLSFPKMAGGPDGWLVGEWDAL